jgi:hypothetical protein
MLLAEGPVGGLRGCCPQGGPECAMVEYIDRGPQVSSHAHCTTRLASRAAACAEQMPGAQGAPPGSLSLMQKAVHLDGAAFAYESCGQAVEVHLPTALQCIRSQTDDLPCSEGGRNGPAHGFDQI